MLIEDDFSLDFEEGSALVVDDSATVKSIEYKDMQLIEYLDFMTELRGIAAKPEYVHFKFYFTGNAPMMEFAMNNMKQAGILLTIMVLIVVGFLWFLFHSLSAVIWPILVIAGSAFWTIGGASWLDITLSNMVTLTFMLILAVGVADMRACIECLYSLSPRATCSSKGNDIGLP